MSFDPSRREVLKRAIFAFAAVALAEDEELVDFADLGTFRVENHTELPRVKFFDLRHLTTPRTPEAEFFTFHQTHTPRIDIASWRLHIGGFVERPIEMTLDQIKARRDKREIPFTLECSGNTPIGAANGMISHGVWSGVGLASILKECGVKPEAREVVFFGADTERERPEGVDVSHGRSIFLQDAMDSNVTLVYALNGNPLPADRGFPLRVIIPGWFGMTQIKWLNRIEVLDRRYEGPHMARNYHTMNEGEIPLETSISKTRLKSVVARVTRRKDAAGKYAYRVSGAAWGGPLSVKAVEVSVDNGPWRLVRLGDRSGDYAWTLWSFDWDDAKPGNHTLVSRAIDTQGRIQPTEAEWQRSVKTQRENNSQWVRRIAIR